MFISATRIIKDNKLHQLRVESRDYAFTIDSISSYTDELNYVYQPQENVTINFDKNKCIVETKHKDVNRPIKFFCGSDIISDLEIEKTNNNIKISK